MDEYEGVNELIDSQWTIEWCEDAPTLDDEDDEPDRWLLETPWYGPDIAQEGNR